MSEQNTSHRFILSSDDQAGLVVIVTAIGLSWTLCTLLIRIVSKLSIKRSLGVEEILVIAASLFAIATSCCVVVAVKYGFGRKDVTAGSTDEDTIFKLLYTADIFYVVTLSFAKAATLPLLMQLTPIKRFVKASWVIAAFICVWCIVSVALVAFRCHVGSPWDDVTSSQCGSMFSRWAFVESISMTIEVLIFGLFLAIIYMLRMPLKAKAKVVVAFATRLTVIIPTIIRLVYLDNDLQKGDPTFSLVAAVITAQAVLHYTTIASSFAYLKPFLRAFDSNMGATVKVDTIVSGGYLHSSKDRRKTKFATNSFSTTVNSRDDESQHELDSSSGALSPSSRGGNTKRVSHRKKVSSESITPIITKTQQWDIRTETREDVPHAL